MRRYRVPALLTLFSLAVFLPHIVDAATNTGFLGPIIPNVSDANGNLQTCAAGWGGLVEVVGLLVQFAVSLSIVVAALILAYGGFLLVLNPVSPENRSTARKMLINGAIGLVLTLAAWLIINTLLTALGVAGGIGGATSQLFDGGDICIKQATVVAGVPPTSGVAATSSTPATPGTNAGTDNLNAQAAASYLQSNYTSTVSNHRCLAAIEGAFSAGGLTLSCPSGYAGMCNGSLQSLGFQSLGSGDSSPQAGDVVVIQHVNGSDSIGHIAMFTGSTWISDFVQSNSETPPGNPYPANQFGGAQYWRP